MAMKNIDGYGQFRKMDKRSVLGSLKATGSRDPDVLLLQKQKLLAPNKSSRFAGFCLAILGALLSLTIIGAILGVPLLLLGGWFWWVGRQNISVVESAYDEYVGSAQH